MILFIFSFRKLNIKIILKGGHIAEWRRYKTLAPTTTHWGTPTFSLRLLPHLGFLASLGLLCLTWASLPLLGFSASLGLLCLLGLFAPIGTIGLSLVVPSLGPRPPDIEPVLRSLNTSVLLTELLVNTRGRLQFEST